MSHHTKPEEVEQLFSEEMKRSQAKPINQVQLDALVVLKIVNHCMEKIPNVLVSGSLVGLNVENTLEVTDCYAVPSESDFEVSEDSGESAVDKMKQHQLDMLKYMTRANADSNSVGWYQSNIMEQYNTVQTIDNHYKHQLQQGQRCVCIVFDPMRSHNGHLELHAVRLTEQFLDAIKKLYLEKMEHQLEATAAAAQLTAGARQQAMEEEKKELEDLRALQREIPTAVMPQSIEDITITQELLMSKRFKNLKIFEELPIVIKNRTLVEAYMNDLANESSYLDDDISFDCLDLATGPYLERELGGLVESSDDLLSDLKDLANYQRRASRTRTKPEEQPNRLHGIVIGMQMDKHVQHLNSYAAQGINNIYLSKATMRQTEQQ